MVDRIEEISGISYEFIDNPFIGDDTSGGEPGGNIRTTFLYNPNRVSLSDEPLPDQPFEGSVQTVVDSQDQQTNPDNPFFDTRLPLVGFFSFKGQEEVVVNNHFSSKGGSAPLFGALQPAVDFQEDPTINGDVDDRRQQAQAVKAYIEDLSQENVAAIGDFNEFEFISPLDILEETLTNLTETLPADERYSFIFDGNSQGLDHILVSDRLSDNSLFDTVHINAEFAATDTRASDHEPLLASLVIAEPEPVVLEGGNGKDSLSGGLGNDLLSGGNGQDTLVGLAGDDSLEGGNSKDLLDGGAGDDLLNGGNGKDTFVIASGNGSDTIEDFSNDLIGLAGGLSYDDLTFSGNTIRFGQEVLATLTGVDTASLSGSDFIAI
ncbi:hypothetical protein [Myxosarcina sp. GI1(2024)]